jgi:hypothetical protein
VLPVQRYAAAATAAGNSLHMACMHAITATSYHKTTQKLHLLPALQLNA